MNQQPHISDQDLQRVIEDNEALDNQVEIETHISNCDQCQTRLMSLAADPKWRSEFMGHLSEDFSSDFASSSEITISSKPSTSKDRQGDEYDLDTVDAMLKEILAPPIHPETLGRLGRYEIESIIGCGGMGVVVRGYDRDLQRPVAIKLILPRLSKNGTAKQRFAREARAAAAILHPNVIAIHGIDESHGVPYFVMPLILGPSLRDLVLEQGPLPEREIIRIGLQIASGLAAAHSQGLVHRDIKPENILIDNRVNRVVITDFGLARREAEQPMTQAGCLAGTLNYMSPEQAQGKDVDARSDLFSLGSVLYYLATGETPFSSDSPMGVILQVTKEPHADARTLNPEISATLSNTIDRLLEKEPAHRFQSAVDLESFLEQFIAHLHQPTNKHLPKVPQSKSKKNLRVGVPQLALTVLVVAAMASAFWLGSMWFKKKPPQSPKAIWAEIQNSYQIEDESKFHQELVSLGRSVSAMDRMMDDGQPLESNALNQEARDLKQQLDQIDRALR